MAKCISCGADIPEGAEYCAECLSKLNTAKDSESYLDSLLSAVMTDEPERREIVYPKREASSLVSVPKDKVPAEEEISEPEEESPMEDVFGVFFDADEELPDLSNYSIFGDVDERTVDRMLAEELGEASWESEELSETSWESEEPAEDETEDEEQDEITEFGDLSEFYGEDSEEEVLSSEVGDIEDLFGMLEDERGADAPEEIEMAVPEIISAEALEDAADTFSGIVEVPEEDVPATEFGDFADLFGEADGDEEASSEELPADVDAAEFGDFADLFAAGDVVQDEVPTQDVGMKEQTFDDFADLFGGQDGDVGGLFEFGAEPEEINVSEEEQEEDVFSALSATVSDSVESQDVGTPVNAGKKKVKKRRLAALYHKLFDNVKMDPSKIKQPPTKEEIEAQKKAKKEAKERSKEEKEALLAEKKEQENQVKQEKQRVKKEAKAEKKAKKMEEAKLLLEEMERTRINRAGASIVFIFFAMIAVVIIVGTSIFSYSLSIRNAEYEFNRDEYTLAYNEIYGLEIKDEDIVLYDRIMTVMYVQKQLNSYDNYYRMNDKPRALDSLLKGLQRYEKYIELAVELDVDSDLDSVRNKILSNISTSFLLTEQEAMEIIQSDSQAEYSKRVYDAVDALE